MTSPKYQISMGTLKRQYTRRFTNTPRARNIRLGKKSLARYTIGNPGKNNHGQASRRTIKDGNS